VADRRAGFLTLSDDELEPVLERVNELNRERRKRSVDLTANELRMFTNSRGSVRTRLSARDEGGRMVGMSETRHAETTDSMLSINRAMCFKHEMTTKDVEIPVDDAPAYVAARS
jgi:hypothetical protein